MMSTPAQIPPGYTAGIWHEGNTVDCRVSTHGRDSYPRNFTCYVEIRIRSTGAIHIEQGRGRYVGNFAPIFVHWKGRFWQVTELLRA